MTPKARRRTDGDTLLFATAGNPVAQVRLPQVMDAVFGALGINAVWVPMAVDAAGLRLVLDGLRRIGNFRGLTVAIPHKPAVLGLVDVTTTAAQASGAVNLVRLDPDGRLHGDMADGAGFVRGLERRGIAPRNASAWLVGCGGGGSAIAAALAAAGIGRLCVSDTAPERVRALQQRLARHFPVVRVEQAGAVPPAGKIDFAINATPLGLREGDPLAFDPAALGATAMVCDIVMKPKDTPLLRAAAAAGLRVHHGHHMLDAQIPLYMTFLGLPFADEDAVIAIASRA